MEQSSSYVKMTDSKIPADENEMTKCKLCLKNCLMNTTNLSRTWSVFIS